MDNQQVIEVHTLMTTLQCLRTCAILILVRREYLNDGLVLSLHCVHGVYLNIYWSKGKSYSWNVPFTTK